MCFKYFNGQCTGASPSLCTYNLEKKKRKEKKRKEKKRKEKKRKKKRKEEKRREEKRKKRREKKQNKKQKGRKKRKQLSWSSDSYLQLNFSLIATLASYYENNISDTQPSVNSVQSYGASRAEAVVST